MKSMVNQKSIALSLEQERSIIEQSLGDRSAFSRIYEAYAINVYRFAFALTQNRENAEDITSTTFLKAIEKLDSYKDRGFSIKSWLFGIARNQIYDKFRKSKKGLEGVEINDLPEEDMLDRISEKFDDPKLERDLQANLLILPEMTREIIILKIWEEYKFAEIAELVDKSEVAVKKQFYRGLDKLKDELAKKGYQKDYLAVPYLFGGIGQIGDTISGSIDFSSLINFEQLINSNLIIKNTMLITKTKLALAILGTVIFTTAATLGGVYLYGEMTKEDPKSAEVVKEDKKDVEEEAETPVEETPVVVEEEEKPEAPAPQPTTKPFSMTINPTIGDSKFTIDGDAPIGSKVELFDFYGNGKPVAFTVKFDNTTLTMRAHHESFDTSYTNLKTVTGTPYSRYETSVENTVAYIYTKFVSQKECAQFGPPGIKAPCGPSHLVEAKTQPEYIFYVTCKYGSAAEIAKCDEIVSSLAIQ